MSAAKYIHFPSLVKVWNPDNDQTAHLDPRDLVAEVERAMIFYREMFGERRPSRQVVGVSDVLLEFIEGDLDEEYFERSDNGRTVEFASMADLRRYLLLSVEAAAQAAGNPDAALAGYREAYRAAANLCNF